MDDAVCGLISILDAMNTGDNDRFHLETLHHSKQEIRRILERGGKIDRTAEYAVDDEDEEYELSLIHISFLCLGGAEMEGICPVLLPAIADHSSGGQLVDPVFYQRHRLTS